MEEDSDEGRVNAGTEHMIKVKQQQEELAPSNAAAGTERGMGTFRRHKKCITCCGITAALLASALLALLIVIFVVLKPKDPSVTVTQVVVQGVSLGLDLPSLQPRGNLTLGITVAVHNPNKVSFAYRNSTAVLFYRGTQVGEVPIAAGEMRAARTVSNNLTATILVDRFLANPGIVADLMAQALPLTTEANVTGKINVLNVYRKRATAFSSCNTTVFLNNATTGPNDCDYKTEL